MNKISRTIAPAAPHHPMPNWQPQPYPVPPALAGSATVTPACPVEAGSWQSFTLVYTAGRFGIDDSGSLKVCFRFATDQTRLQLDDPSGPGFVTVEASNGADADNRRGTQVSRTDGRAAATASHSQRRLGERVKHSQDPQCGLCPNRLHRNMGWDLHGQRT